RCPVKGACKARGIDVPFTPTTCPSCGEPVFPTDALRLHEEVSEEQSNAGPLGRLMSVVEHLTLVGYLDHLARRAPGLLGRGGFPVDGPLALFGCAQYHQPAPRAEPPERCPG